MAKIDAPPSTVALLKSDWDVKLPLSKALVQIALATTVLLGGAFAYRAAAKAKAESNQLIREARSKAIIDTPESLLAAIGAVEKAIGTRDSKEAQAALAALNVRATLDLRLPGAEAKWNEALTKAQSMGAQTEDYFFATLMRDIERAKNPAEAATVVAAIDAQRQAGVGGPLVTLAHARALEKAGQLGAARIAYTQASDQAFRSAYILGQRAEALLRQGALWPALEGFARALQQTKNAHTRSQALSVLARSLLGMRSEQMKSEVETLVGKSANLPPGTKSLVLVGQAGWLGLNGDWEAAKVAATQAKSADDAQGYAQFMLARIDAEQKKSEATAAFNALVAAYPDVPLYYFEGTTSLVKAGQIESAMKLLDAYEARFGQVKVSGGTGTSALERDDRFWLARGDVLRQLNQSDMALQAYDKAIVASGPSTPRAYFEKARLLLAAKKEDEALADLVRITPGDGSGAIPEAYVSAADLQFKKGDYPTACLNYAFSLTKLRLAGQPAAKLKELYDGVTRKLRGVGQKEMADAWVKEAAPLVPAQ